MINNAIWKPFGISDPVAELAVHPHPTMRLMRDLAEELGEIHADLQIYLAGMVLMAYGFGLTQGRLESLENPEKAAQAEWEAMRSRGIITDSEAARAIDEERLARNMNKTLGDKCASCHHMRGDHTMFVGSCAHVYDNPAKECHCKKFIEPKPKESK